MRAVMVVALLLAGSVARADIFDAAAIAGAAGDIVTTEMGLKRGFVEQNIQTRGPRIGANVLLTSACLFAGREVQKQGHKGWAKAVKLVPFVMFGGAAIKNLSAMRGGR